MTLGAVFWILTTLSRFKVGTQLDAELSVHANSSEERRIKRGIFIFLGKIDLHLKNKPAPDD
jgi:hypothetical protein